MITSDPHAHDFFRSYDRAFQSIADAAEDRGFSLPAQSRHKALGEALDRYWPWLRDEYDHLKALRMRIKYDGHAVSEEELERAHRFEQEVCDATTA